MEETQINALLLRVKEGEDEAFSTLSDHFRPLLAAAVSGISSKMLSADELLQEARLALYHAALSYRTGQDEVTFGLYAKICVRNALISACRRRNAHVDICSLEEISEGDVFRQGETAADLSLHLIGLEEAERLNDKIRKTLSAWEMQVFTQYVDGLSPREIAAKLAKPQKSVENAVQRAITKLKLLLR